MLAACERLAHLAAEAAIDSQLLIDILVELESYLRKTATPIGPTEKVLVAMVFYDAARRDGRSKFAMDDVAIKILKLALRKPRTPAVAGA